MAGAPQTWYRDERGWWYGVIPASPIFPILEINRRRPTESDVPIYGRHRPSFSEGVEWCAYNDEPEDLDEESVSGYISTLLLAAVFDKDAIDVARAIIRARKEA